MDFGGRYWSCVADFVSNGFLGYTNISIDTKIICLSATAIIFWKFLVPHINFGGHFGFRALKNYASIFQRGPRAKFRLIYVTGEAAIRGVVNCPKMV